MCSSLAMTLMKIISSKAARTIQSPSSFVSPFPAPRFLALVLPHLIAQLRVTYCDRYLPHTVHLISCTLSLPLSHIPHLCCRHTSFFDFFSKGGHLSGRQNNVVGFRVRVNDDDSGVWWWLENHCGVIAILMTLKNIVGWGVVPRMAPPPSKGGST